jgi:predicted amidophosphoribosyltransferase
MRDVRAWQWWAALADLVLPAECAGCGRVDQGQLCAGCAATVSQMTPRPTSPDPRPDGLPPCLALGPYQGIIRSLLLAYKERGAHLLARPLGRALAAGVAAVASEIGRPVALVGIPSTASAVRERHGDHVARVGRHAAAELRRSGIAAAYAPRVLRARPKADASHLNAYARAEAAAEAFRVRDRRVQALRSAQCHGVALIVIDDIITTGSTLASACRLLAANGVEVDAAVTLAATQRWGAGAARACVRYLEKPPYRGIRPQRWPTAPAVRIRP